MIRRPPRSTQSRSSAASDVYKRQVFFFNSQQVNVHKRVSINVNKQNIFKILDEVFKGSDVVYSVLDKSIILSSKRFAPDGNLKKITGKVVDTNGEPLIGVTIALKGSNRGTVSDVNGNFSLNGEEGMSLIHICS